MEHLSFFSSFALLVSVENTIKQWAERKNYLIKSLGYQILSWNVLEPGQITKCQILVWKVSWLIQEHFRIHQYKHIGGMVE